MTAPRQLHVVVPEGIDDPARVSGGNTYDRRLVQELVARGWSLRLRAVPGAAWPWPDEAAREALRAALSEPPDGAVTLVDGLLASAVPDVVVPAAARLRLVVLLHMPLGDRSSGAAACERAVLRAAAATVTTSEWARSWVLAAYRLDAARVRAAPPGVDLGEPATGSGGGGDLLCVASVTSVKGHDVLVRALARVADLPWRCRCAGAVVRAPGFVADLTRVIDAWGLHGRVLLTGPLTGAALEEAYAGADALVLPSRSESYGMVVTEALARGLPVLASDVGGVPEALGVAGDGRCPGMLLPAGDAAALAAALRRWLTDATLREDLRSAASDRRLLLTGWSETVEQVTDVLQAVAA